MLSVVLGVSLRACVGSVRALREVLNPFVVALYGMPKILVLPWIVLLLGFGTAPGRSSTAPSTGSSRSWCW